jgi:hypothetical protein
VAGWFLAVWRKVIGSGGGRPIPLKVRVNAMVIEDVALKLHPGRRDDESKNDAAFRISDSTYELIDELARSVESDVEAARRVDQP